MAPSIYIVVECMRYSPQLPKLNWEPTPTIPKQHALSKKPSPKWAIPKTLPPSQPTPPLLPAYPTAPSSNDAPRPSICNTIGYAIAFHKDNSLWYEKKEKAT
jgi:hypothetical protein